MKTSLYIKLIIQGWKNYILDIISDIKYKKEFNDRLKICHSCDFNKLGICEKCFCVLDAKTKAEDAECPIGKWKTIEETLKKAAN